MMTPGVRSVGDNGFRIRFLCIIQLPKEVFALRKYHLVIGICIEFFCCENIYFCANHGRLIYIYLFMLISRILFP